MHWMKSYTVLSPLLNGAHHGRRALVVLALAALVGEETVVVYAHYAYHGVDGALGENIVLPSLCHDSKGFVEQARGERAACCECVRDVAPVDHTEVEQMLRQDSVLPAAACMAMLAHYILASFRYKIEVS